MWSVIGKERNLDLTANFYNPPKKFFIIFINITERKDNFLKVTFVKWDVNQNECCCNEKLFDHGISNDCHAQSELHKELEHCEQDLPHLSPGLQLSDGFAKPHCDGS